MERPTATPDRSADGLPWTWRRCYREVELYKSAVRLYTKPLFDARKARLTSIDGRTLFDFARHGVQSLARLHRQLQKGEFRFRPARALTRTFDGKTRRLYIWPWEERLVSLLIYRLLTRRLDGWFSRHSYAYRRQGLGFGLDRCQREIARAIRHTPRPLYVIKRDITDYFGSIDHDLLRGQLAPIVTPDDYLGELLDQCIRFQFVDEQGDLRQATRGVPFGTAVACLCANVYLTSLDRELERIPDLRFYRYADDILMLAATRASYQQARDAFDRQLDELRLTSKASQSTDLVLPAPGTERRSEVPTERAGAGADASAGELAVATRFRHLGLEFRSDYSIGLSRDKARKIRNLFKFAFRRYAQTLGKLSDPRRRAALAARIAQRTIGEGVRNVAIIDYYLKHVDDEKQLRDIDRWLAEEVLSLAFGGGHKRRYFRLISFAELRKMGLPSLVHRRRLIAHGRIESPFFVWKERRAGRGNRGKVARSVRRPSLEARKQQS